ncbi:MAG: CcmD family protein [Armatimonadota bacterium]|nr:CcmD family protein [Armatimonadota bacterium]MDR7445126.1 CcmD family protein [Armatimonadota bacterium]MDR7569773.1 CcmD family protein [Armatimonadota bacterium]MDR7614026.1 CcmD family protein [Armatimonadota bacterium]
MVYLFWAYWLVWVALVAYLMWLHHRTSQLHQEITRLEAQVREGKRTEPHGFVEDRQ